MDFFWNMEENFGNFDEISQDASASERYKISKADVYFLKISRCARCKLLNQINILVLFILVSSEETILMLFFARRAKFF